MKPSEKLLKIKNDKAINSIAIVDRMEYLKDGTTLRTRAFRFFLNVKDKYSEEIFPVMFDEPADIRYEDYTQDVEVKPKDSPLLYVFFYESYYHNQDSHWKTFLKKIKKDCDISFKIRINNNSEFNARNGTGHHQLFGFINDDCYFLKDFVGEQNSASPVQWQNR
jgi:hypothetical protein